MTFKEDTIRRIHAMARDDRLAPMFADMKIARHAPLDVLGELADVFMPELGVGHEERDKVVYLLALASMATDIPPREKPNG